MTRVRRSPEAGVMLPRTAAELTIIVVAVVLRAVVKYVSWEIEE
jgi:hypothetical protein